MAKPLDDRMLHLIDACWRASNYLTVGQIYLREPLKAEHLKPRLLGHWRTSSRQNFIYPHLNRLIIENDVDMIYVSGPGHGGPSPVAHTWLEGTYSEFYLEIRQDTLGIARLFRQFSTPGRVPSHAGPHLPGSIREGGELGYSLVHAFDAVFDNPNLIVACVIGDGEAETGPLAGGWKGIKFLNRARDGAVLPILHLDGFKISVPTVLARHDDEDIRRLLEGHGYEVHLLEGDEPPRMHREFAAMLDECYATIHATLDNARRRNDLTRPRWPAIVLRTSKGWTGPKIVDGVKIEGTFRAHQVPQGPRRMGANPHANGGTITVSFDTPSFVDYAVPVEVPGAAHVESTRPLGAMLRDIFRRDAREAKVRRFCPDETNSNRLGDVCEVENRCLVSHVEPGDDHGPTGWPRDGSPERALAPGNGSKARRSPDATARSRLTRRSP